MAKRITGSRRISLVALWAGLLAAGCAAKDLSVGDESAAFNLDRCYGTECEGSSQATLGVETGVRDCSEAPIGTLEEEQVFLPAPGAPAFARFSVGPDGSVWALSGETTYTDIVLSHYSPEGALLGVTPALAVQKEHTSLSCDLAVDSAGQALVSIYSSHADTADSLVAERLVIYTFDSELRAVREPLLFRGAGEAILAGGAGDSFILAGDSQRNAPHGVLARVFAGEADWIQTAVPSSGLGAGVGVSGLAVSPNGDASVLAQRSPRWEPGAPDEYRYGIARFDDTGSLLWNLELPTRYAGGYRAGLASAASGDLVVRGLLTAADVNEQKTLVRLVTREGDLGWAFTLRGGFDESLAVDSTGRAILSSIDAVVVVSADGQRCEQYQVPVPEGQIRSISSVHVQGVSIYANVAGGVRRYRTPAE